jgi:hypothetical protein
VRMSGWLLPKTRPSPSVCQLQVLLDNNSCLLLDRCFNQLSHGASHNSCLKCKDKWALKKPSQSHFIYYGYPETSNPFLLTSLYPSPPTPYLPSPSLSLSSPGYTSNLDVRNEDFFSS